MRVLHAQQVEVLLPIRTFFRQWRRTETNFDPGYRTITTKPIVFHVFEIFVASDGAPFINGLYESQFLSRLQPCLNEVAHTTADDTPKVPSVLHSRIVGCDNIGPSKGVDNLGLLGPEPKKSMDVVERQLASARKVEVSGSPTTAILSVFPPPGVHFDLHSL
jgi:hypothetical protein